MDFSKAKKTYRQNAITQKIMAFKLISVLKENFNPNFDTIFEIGAGTGFLTDNINKYLNYKKIVLNDITDNFTNFIPDDFIKGDIIKVEIPYKFDLILSNAVFQWIDDYDLLFKKLFEILNNGGKVVFSTFGEKNFIQIKNTLNIGLDYPKLDSFIQNAGFKIVYFEEELKTIYFDNIKKLLEHIKLTGAKTENKFRTKSDFLNFQNQYLEKYKDSKGFELTYHPIYYVLKKEI